MNIKKIAAFLTSICAMLIAEAAFAQSSSLNPLDDLSDSPAEIFGRVIRTLLGLVGVIALIFFIIGGFRLIFSRGNSQEVQKGKDTIYWSLIGLIVAFSSYAILKFVLEAITGS